MGTDLTSSHEGKSLDKHILISMYKDREVLESCRGHGVSVVLSYRTVKTTKTPVPHYDVQKTCLTHRPHPDNMGVLRPLPTQKRGGNTSES